MQGTGSGLLYTYKFSVQGGGMMKGQGSVLKVVA